MSNEIKKQNSGKCSSQYSWKVNHTQWVQSGYFSICLIKFNHASLLTRLKQAIHLYESEIQKKKKAMGFLKQTATAFIKIENSHKLRWSNTTFFIFYKSDRFFAKKFFCCLFVLLFFVHVNYNPIIWSLIKEVTQTHNNIGTTQHKFWR